MREKNKLQYKREYERHKEEAGVMEDDIGFLDKIEENFDPIEAYRDQNLLPIGLHGANAVNQLLLLPNLLRRLHRNLAKHRGGLDR